MNAKKFAPATLNFIKLPILICGCLLLSGNALAQNNKKAKSDYEKAQKAFEKKEYKQVLELYTEVLKAEMADDNPDYAFMGKVLDELAAFYSRPGYFVNAADYYFYAAIQYGKANLIDASKNSLYQASLIHDSVQKYNEVVERTSLSEGYSSVNFSVKSVDKVKGDTSFFTLDAGTNEGVSVGQSGWILTRYDASIARGNDIFGNCRITSVNNTFSKGWAVVSADSKAAKLQLMENDNVQIQVKIKDNTYEGILFRLAKLNVHFTDDYKKRFLQYDHIISLSKPESEEVIISTMRNIIIGTAEYLYDPKNYDKQTYQTLTDGLFSGQNMWEAMLNTTNEDIRLFLRFVESFPAKYMGRNFRIDETYATWIINATPLGEEESGRLTAELLDSFNPQFANEWFAKNLNLIKNGGLDYSKISDRIYEIMGDSNYTLAGEMSDLMIDVSRKMKKDSLANVFLNVKGQNQQSQKKYDAAIAIFSQVLQSDPHNINAYWFRGNAYLSNEEYKRAQADYKHIMDDEDYGEWAGAHAMYGWAFLKTSDAPKALEHCQKAYQLDSFNASYIMNLGHAYLLLDQPQMARRLYLRSMDNMESESSFTEGLMEDFDFFIKKHTRVEEIKRERVFLTNQWETYYKNKTLAKENFEKGKTLETKAEYAKAGLAFDNAIGYALKSSNVQYDVVRNYQRWAAYQYYNTKEYEKSLARYQAGWEVNRLHLGRLEDEIKDLESIGNLYSWLDNDLQKDMYRKMQGAAQRKLLSTSQSNSLYVISIGLNNFNTSAYKYAESDANTIGSLLKEKSKLVFDKSDVQVFTGSLANATEIKRAFEKVIGASRPGDCFILYYTGYCHKNIDGKLLLGTDTITNEQLLAWLSLMQADKKLILMDAANNALITQYAAKSQGMAGLNKNDNVTYLLSDGRIELPDMNSGLFTNYLTKAISGDAVADWGTKYALVLNYKEEALSYVSAKGVEGYMYGNMINGNMQFELKSYSQGADFPITFTNDRTYSKDTMPPMIFIIEAISSDGKRGATSKTVTTKGVIHGQALDASGIEAIVVNGRQITFSQNGKFELGEKEKGRDVKFIIEAKDKNGLWSKDSFELIDGFANAAPGKDAQSQNIQGTNYALLIATNEYDHWSNLKNPIRDVHAIGEILSRDYGFKVKILENKTLEQLQIALDSFYNLPYTSKDQLLVFVAGHGINVPNYGGYVICKDSKKAEGVLAQNSFLSFESIKNGLSRTYKCKHIMLTFDVCFGGAGFDDRKDLYYGSSLSDIRQNPHAYLDKTLGYYTRLYLTSGDSTYVSDGVGTHSPFAEKFIATLNTETSVNNGVLTLQDFVGNMRFTDKGKQQIRYGTFGTSEQDGDFVFIRSNKAEKSNTAVMTKSLGF